MIISSERKLNSCSRCNGTGSITESAVLPWMPDDHTSCPKCHGKGKTEKTDYNYDKNVFNIDDVVTIGEIEIDNLNHGLDCEINHPVVKFYINGHIKIEKVGNEFFDYNENHTKDYNKEKEKIYLKLKSIRDDIIKRLKKNKIK